MYRSDRLDALTPTLERRFAGKSFEEAAVRAAIGRVYLGAGEPGKAGAAGAGGRNLMYYYEWLKGHYAFAGSGQNSTIDQLARKFKVSARAKAGNAGAPVGSVPATPVAAAGSAGSVTVQPAKAAAVAEGFDLPFLQLVLALARQDLVAGRDASAQQRLQWLLRVTQPLTDPAATVSANTTLNWTEPSLSVPIPSFRTRLVIWFGALVS